MKIRAFLGGVGFGLGVGFGWRVVDDDDDGDGWEEEGIKVTTCSYAVDCRDGEVGVGFG